jgi:hypothetical protein
LYPDAGRDAGEVVVAHPDTGAADDRQTRGTA